MMNDNTGGTIEVGHTEQGEVVLNLDKDRTGHLIFSPAQARTLASSMLRKADEAERLNYRPSPRAQLDIDDARTPAQLIADDEQPRCAEHREPMGLDESGENWVCNAEIEYPRDAPPRRLCPCTCPTAQTLLKRRAEHEKLAAELKLATDAMLLKRFETEGYAVLRTMPPVVYALDASTAFWLLQFIIIALGMQGMRGPNAQAVREFIEKIVEPSVCVHPLLSELTRRGWARLKSATHPATGPRLWTPGKGA